MDDLKSNNDRNLLNLRDSCVPSVPTSNTIAKIDHKSLYALNSLANVKIDRDLHGQFSLNELVLELSHFLDSEIIDKIEMNVYS